jgi:serine/threonine protein kinase
VHQGYSDRLLADLPAGTVLRGIYQIEKKAGGGGMAVVYRAIDLRDSTIVWAVKEMRPQSATAIEQSEAKDLFEKEAKFLGGLVHPNLPKVVDRFDEAGRTYLVMEYIDGQPLDELQTAAGGILPEKTVLGWMIQVCAALVYLHGQSPPIIFRDLKPGNIMLSRAGVIKLIDFGIARHFAPGKVKDTKLLGTPGYAPPEQHGMGQTRAYSDIYALGATTYHLVTGTPPPFATLPFPLVAPRVLNPSLSSEVEAVILKAMQKDPKDRYQTADECAEAMRHALGPDADSDRIRKSPPPTLCTKCSYPNRPQARFCGRCGASMAGSLPAILQILGPKGVDWDMPVGRMPFLIGRLDELQARPDLDLSFYDSKYISRRHAEISQNGIDYLLTDLDSANGTFVNEQQLAAQMPYTLHNGDQMRIGAVRLVFRLGLPG